MKKYFFFFLLILAILISGCATGNYYIYKTDTNIELQTSKYSVKPYMYIPKGKHLLVKEGTSYFKKAQYGDNKGYICGISNLSNPIFIPSKELKHLTFSSKDSVYYYKEKAIDSYKPTNSKSSYVPSKSTGTVRVKGYYRKDGTYVRPHTRKSPTKRR